MKKLSLFVCLLFSVSMMAQEADIKVLQKAMDLLKAKNFHESIKEFNKYLEKPNNDPKVYFNRGLAYMYINEFNLAIVDFDESIKIDSTFADAYNIRGLAKSYLNKLYPALDDFNKALKLNKEFGEAYMNRASVYIAFKSKDSAIRDLNSAIKYIGNNPELYSQRARLNYQTGEFQKAIDDYTKAINLGLKISKSFYNRANAYFKLKKYDLAIKDYTKALEINPKDLEALNNRAFAYESLGKKDLAAKDRESLDRLRMPVLKPLDSLQYKTFSDSKSEVSVDLPDDWVLVESKTQDGIEVLISPNKIDANSDAMPVGVTIGVVKNMSTKYKVDSESGIIEFWKGSANISNKELFLYDVRSEKHMMLFGHNTVLLKTEVKATKDAISLGMYEYIIGWGDNLVYLYFQAPKSQFEYYEKIFEKAIKSVKIVEELK